MAKNKQNFIQEPPQPKLLAVIILVMFRKGLPEGWGEYTPYGR
jgi:hypothetical protein